MWLHSPLLFIYLLNLVAFAVAQAGGGSESHGEERIWLYAAYEVAWVLEGRNQQYILPFLTLDRDRNAKNNDGHRGSGPDQKLEFKEFMDDIAGQWPGSCTIELTDDLDDVAYKLTKGGFAKALKVIQARGWKFSQKAVAKTPTLYDYDVFLKDLSDMVNKCRKEKGDSVIQEQLDKMKTLAEKIVPIRDADFRQQKWITKDVEDEFLTRKKKDPASGEEVKDDDASGKIIYEQIDQGGTKVDDLTRPDFKKTIADAKNKKLFKEKMGNSKTWRSDVNKWIDQYADNAWIETANKHGEDIPTYPERAQTHFKVLQAWKSISEMHGRCVS
ncbi:hypothetical protein diail_6078 [Diaporthe ilicicola]|nr:hypothetical protein diail_6078 [Diaporthe ilicicola]